MNEDQDRRDDQHVIIGSGPVGRATARALLAKGKNVAIVNRKGKLAECPEGATVLAGDLADPGSLEPRIAGAAAIYFCAQPLYHRWPQEFPALQDAVIGLAEASAAKLIVAENLYGYGPVSAPMTETMPLLSTTRKGMVRAAMHRALMTAHASGRVNVAVARSSDFFGSFVDGSAAGSRAFNAIVTGKAVEYFGNLDAPHSYTFVDDFGTALATLGTDDRAIGQVWHVPNAPTVSSLEFFSNAFAIAAHHPSFRKVGWLEMRALGLFIPPLREMEEMIYEFEDSFVVDASKFKRTFGDIATPLHDALTLTVDWTLAAVEQRARKYDRADGPKA